ncbi:MAG: hypothetical protein QMB22_02595 [Dehalococcoidia bacterium]|nr:MAG: hypothetical protein DK305_000252 [Chloroflexota bacterium]
MLVTFFGLFAVVYGYLNPPKLQIRDFYVGELHSFSIGQVVFFENENFYLIGMKNGNLRALSSSFNNECNVSFFAQRPVEDIKFKPFSLDNIFFDNCQNAWDINGNNLMGNKVPLKTLFVKIKSSGNDQKVIVELIN